jgi:PPOX class probable FMN-dependent enzyme
MRFMNTPPERIETVQQLRTLYDAPKERSVRKQLDRLDRHARAFIALSPFFVLSTSDGHGRHDASPRGGAPGFVKIDEHGDLLVPDSPGNNRLDSLQNIIAHGRAGLLFLVPGVDETLRVNGAAWISTSEPERERCRDERRLPKSVIHVKVEEAYLHCAKAFMRSRLWDPAARVERAVLPTMGEMINEQIGASGPAESQEEMLRRYQADL